MTESEWRCKCEFIVPTKQLKIGGAEASKGDVTRGLNNRMCSAAQKNIERLTISRADGDVYMYINDYE